MIKSLACCNEICSDKFLALSPSSSKERSNVCDYSWRIKDREQNSGGQYKPLIKSLACCDGYSWRMKGREQNSEGQYKPLIKSLACCNVI